MAMTQSERVQKRRAALRAQGLRPVQLWVPDTRAPGFRGELSRQCSLVADAEALDIEFAEFWDEIADDALRDDGPAA